MLIYLGCKAEDVYSRHSAKQDYVSAENFYAAVLNALPAPKGNLRWKSATGPSFLTRLQPVYAGVETYFRVIHEEIQKRTKNYNL